MNMCLSRFSGITKSGESPWLGFIFGSVPISHNCYSTMSCYRTCEQLEQLLGEWEKGVHLWQRSREPEPLTEQEQYQVKQWEREQRQDYMKFQQGDPSVLLDKESFDLLTMLGFDLNIEADEEHVENVNVEQESQEEEEETTDIIDVIDNDSHSRSNTHAAGFLREATEEEKELEGKNSLDHADSEWQAPDDEESEPNESGLKAPDDEDLSSVCGDENAHKLPHGSASRTKTKRQKQWERMFGVLKEYHRMNGHVRVPIKDNKKLYTWIDNQKRRYRAMMDKDYAKTNQRRPMTPEEHGKLVALGLDLEQHKDPPISKIAALKQFQEEHGHVRVAKSDNKELYGWIKSQKERYKVMTDTHYRNISQRKPLSSQEHEKLVALGVAFGPSTSGRSARPKRTRPKGATPPPSAKTMRQDDRGDGLSPASEEVSTMNPRDIGEKGQKTGAIPERNTDKLPNSVPEEGSGQEKEREGKEESSPDHMSVEKEGSNENPDYESDFEYTGEIWI